MILLVVESNYCAEIKELEGGLLTEIMILVGFFYTLSTS